MEKMTKEEKVNVIITFTGLIGIIIFFAFKTHIFPYMAISKIEKKEFKTTCAYVVGKEKVKYSYEYIIKIDNKYYQHREIIPIPGALIIQNSTWNKVPLAIENISFLEINPQQCKKVQYIEVYNIFGFKKFYLYQYLN